VWLGRYEGSSASYDGVLAAGGGRHCRAGAIIISSTVPLADRNRQLFIKHQHSMAAPWVLFRVKARNRALGGEG
jgi:hypothetical protein